MRKWVLMLLLLSSVVIADKAGLVVQFDNSTVIKKCIEFQSGASAFDVLENSGLQIATRDFGPGLGMALCKIGDVGCSADNCFCQSEYWGFYYLSGGSWEYAPVGISGYTISNGDVLGFRWGAYGDKPELHSFGEICSSPTQGGGGRPVRHFVITMNGNCSKEPFVINVKEKEEGGVIWEPTAFSLAGDQNIKVESGVGIKVLLHEIYFGRDAGFEKVAFLFTNKEGNTSFIPEKAGKYRLEFEKGGDFLREEREIEIDVCKREMTVTNKSVEEPKSEKKEVESNITRVDIISPETAVVNSTVILRMLSETGEPLANESIIAEFSGSMKGLITNESGEVAFTAEKEGVYSYSSPNHTLLVYRVTNVIEATKVVLKSKTPLVMQRDETPPSVGMAVANPLQNALSALVGGIIVLALLYMLQKARKMHSGKS